MTSLRVASTVALALVASTIKAQTSHVQVGALPGRSPIVFDTVRNRAVTFGADRLFERDDSRWVRREGLGFSPPPLGGHAMAFDEARGQTLIQGGYSTGINSSHYYLWDGLQWSSPGGVRPTARSDAAMAYDRQRQVIVLFGGSTSGATSFADTWEWDGVQWTQITPTSSPPARERHAMVYDDARGRILLHGGWSYATQALADTWEWDGVTWTQLSANGPSSTNRMVMAYDAARQRTVAAVPSATDTDTFEWDGVAWTHVATTGPTLQSFFGESFYFDPFTQSVTSISDSHRTWIWVGVTWILVDGPRRPSGLQLGERRKMAYDSQRQRAVMVNDGETWEWDGERWSVVATSPQPMPRDYAIAYDPVRQRSVLYGGQINQVYQSDVWEWDGATWTHATPVGMPPARSLAALAWDAASQSLVMFGGFANPAIGQDMWSWNGSNWTQLQPASLPIDAMGDAVADPATGAIYAVSIAGTWRWDGTTWSNLGAPPVSASWPRTYRLAWDIDRQVAVHTHFSTQYEWNGASWTANYPGAGPSSSVGFDGSVSYDEVNRAVLLFSDARRETWLYGALGIAEATIYGSGCPTAAQPRLFGWGRPQLGRSDFKLDVISAPTNQPTWLVYSANTAAVPVSSECVALVDVQATLASVLTLSNAYGSASMPLSIPLDPALAGLAFFAQAATLHPPSPLGLALSNGVAIVVGY